MHATFGCFVGGLRADSPCSGRLTLHHIRHRQHEDGRRELTGKNDYRSMMLCEGHHLHGNLHSVHTLTAPGEWEEFFGVLFEAAIRRYNALWQRLGNPIPTAAQ